MGAIRLPTPSIDVRSDLTGGSALQRCQGLVCQRPTQHDRADGITGPSICGAVQVFLDVNKAFDCAPRAEIIHGLVECGVEPGLATLIGEWHSGARYHYTHLNTHICEHSGQGVRQGCTGAPTLWAVLMTRFLRQLSRLVPKAWTRSEMNVSSDNVCGTWAWSLTVLKNLV